MDLIRYRERSILKRKENTRFLKRLRKFDKKALDRLVNPLHEKVFKSINCLDCANCCKNTGPLFTDKDIIRISKHLGIRPADFTYKYLRIDEDGDYVLQSLPCAFLAQDNVCSIYEVRPKACREFPHTDRIKQYQLLEITNKNLDVCPAVFDIIEKLKILVK